MVLKAASVKGLRSAGESQKWSFRGYVLGIGEGMRQGIDPKQRLMFSRTGTARDTGQKSTKSVHSLSRSLRISDKGKQASQRAGKQAHPIAGKSTANHPR